MSSHPASDPSDLIEPEGVNSTEEPPAGRPTPERVDHATQEPLPMDVEVPAQPGQELAEGEG